MTHATSLPEPDRRRGRWQLILLLLVVIGPILLASAMYKWRFWVPESRSYHGTLIGDGRDLADIGVQAVANGRWQLLVTVPGECDAACGELLYLARQINIGLAREASRASHALASATTLPAELDARLRREYPRLERHALDLRQYREAGQDAAVPSLWIVDPLGNLVLRYGPGVNGKGVLKDLRLLLKLSHIG